MIASPMCTSGMTRTRSNFFTLRRIRRFLRSRYPTSHLLPMMGGSVVLNSQAPKRGNHVVRRLVRWNRNFWNLLSSMREATLGHAFNLGQYPEIIHTLQDGQMDLPITDFSPRARLNP